MIRVNWLIVLLAVCVCSALPISAEEVEFQGLTESDIHYAVRIKDMEGIVALLATNKPLVNAKDERGISALSMAMTLKHMEVAMKLLEEGADIEDLDEDDTTLLYRMVVNGHREEAEVLLDRGASPEYKDDMGNSLLTVSVIAEKKDMLKLLIDKGASLESRNKDGDTALHLVLDDELADILVLAGADMTATNNLGEIPLHKTIKKKGAELEIARLLISSGSDINAQAASGRTPVHYAVEHKLKDFIILLIENEPDLSIVDTNGLDAISFAKEVGKNSITYRLEAHIRKLERAKAVAAKKVELEQMINKF